MTVLGSYHIFFCPREVSFCQNDTGVKADLLACELLGFHLRDLSHFRICSDFFSRSGMCSWTHWREKIERSRCLLHYIIQNISGIYIWGIRAKLVPIFLMHFGCRDLYVFVECWKQLILTTRLKFKIIQCYTYSLSF